MLRIGFSHKPLCATLHRTRRIQTITIACMSAEAVVTFLRARYCRFFMAARTRVYSEFSAANLIIARMPTSGR
jgi:hypothetical protein